MNKKQNSGFSLVELSVVLLIIGLIVAGIVGGSNLLHTAKLNKLISEIRGYATGVENFRNKYNAWPGDMPNAQDYWGLYNSSTNPTGVLNGDGSESLEGDIPEMFQAWSHLAKSGMITGDYDGTGTTHDDINIGVNVPESKAFKNVTYGFRDVFDIYDTSGIFIILKANTAEGEGFIKSEDVYYIDKKIDDGDNGISSATTGNLYALRSASEIGNNTVCVDEFFDQPSANYVLADDSENCRIVYWLEKR